MHMHAVKSSQIKEIGHDPASNTLAVRFNTGALYHYADFGAEKFEAFRTAESIGSHFGKHVKSGHTYKRIDEAEKGEK